MVKSHVQNLNANKICEIGQIIPTTYATYTNLLSIVLAAAAPSSQFTTGGDSEKYSIEKKYNARDNICMYMYVYIHKASQSLACQNSLPSKVFLQPSLHGFPT